MCEMISKENEIKVMWRFVQWSNRDMVFKHVSTVKGPMTTATSGLPCPIKSDVKDK